MISSDWAPPSIIKTCLGFSKLHNWFIVTVWFTIFLELFYFLLNSSNSFLLVTIEL